MSMFFGNSILGRVRILMDKANDNGGGGGGGGSNNPPPADDKDKTIEALTAKIAALEAKNNTPPPAPKPEDDLAEKARKERESLAEKSKTEKSLASAIEFNIKAPQWAKDNATLLPKSIEGIFAQAEKENYSSALDKARDIKVGIVTEFFSIQANLDQLTDSQKILVDEFKKLTKTDRQARVDEIYSSVFEPTFEYSKKLEKAKQVKDGTISPNDVQKAYIERMREISKKHFLKGDK